MSEDSRPDLVLVVESDYFLPLAGGSLALDRHDPMNAYFVGPLTGLGLPHVFHLPNPPALGVTLLATYLRRQGLDVAVLANVFRLARERERFFAMLERRPLAVGISTTFMHSPESVARIAGWVRERSPGTKVLLGGFRAWRKEEVRALGDVTVLGEGEKTLLDLMSALRRGEAWEHVPNLVWRSGGRWASSARQANFTLAERLPPDWELLGMRSTHCYGVEASRGCTHTCAFCAYPNDANQQMMLRPVEDVVAELKRDREKYGITLINFVDSDFTAYPERAEELCRAMMDAGVRATWRCYARADDFARRPSLARIMKEAGCLLVYLGLESGADDVLGRMRKGCTRAQMQEGIRLAKEAGIELHANFVIGFPGETAAARKETLGFIRDSGIDTVSFTVLGVTDELERDARRREDGHLNLNRRTPDRPRSMWSHDTMDFSEAVPVMTEFINAVCSTMERPLVCFQGTLFFPMLAGGLSRDESMELLRAFRDHRRAELRADAPLRKASLERIRGLYSKMLSVYPPATAVFPHEGRPLSHFTY